MKKVIAKVYAHELEASARKLLFTSAHVTIEHYAFYDDGTYSLFLEDSTQYKNYVSLYKIENEQVYIKHQWQEDYKAVDFESFPTEKTFWNLILFKITEYELFHNSETNNE